jgi:bifunctional non-homologous end joining protein LigD
MKKPKPVALDKKLSALLKKGKREPMPKDIEPMLATLVTSPAESGEWVYEMKWDGYRALAYLNGGHVEIRSRNNKSFNDKFYPLHKVMQEWGIHAVIDGELVVVDESGVPDFGGLQLWRSEDDGQLAFYAFDILWLDGYSIMDLPLEERRLILKAVMPPAIPSIRISETIEDSGKEAFRQADQLHLEGVMAKKSGSRYIPGSRSKEWLKIKTEKRQELIIGGYTRNEGTNKLFSALLLGIIEKGKFRFLTPVGTGFNKKMQEEIIKKMKPYETDICPFSTVPEYNKPSRFRPDPPKATVTWVKPKVVAEISYREMTRDGAVRHPSFKGLREDKKPSEVVREVATDTSKLIKENRLVQKKIITAPPKKERATLLNPNEETQTRIIGGHELRFTNLSKIFWPKERLSKRDMINYYYQVAPYMVPYLKDRPQTLNRHPHGIEGESFYQKDVKGKAPDWIETFPYFSFADRREKEFLVATNEASLLYIASLGCIEINPWSSKRTTPDHPDWCIIDLDPDKNSFDQVIQAARVTKEVLDAIGVNSYCKTSGSTGLHIYIPLGAKYTYHDSKEFGRRIAKIVHAELPEFTSIERKTADRGGQMYIDFLQNRPQATVAGPYSLRPKPGAPVSMPLFWEEIKKGLKITDFHMRNAVARVRSEGDIFKGVLGKGIDIEKAIRKIESVFGELLKNVA